MYVCLCKAVTDRDIVAAVHDGVEDLDGIAHSLGAGTCCGGCRDFTQELIEHTLAERLVYAA